MNPDLEQSLKQFAIGQLNKFGIGKEQYSIEVRDNGITYSVSCKAILFGKEKQIEFYNIMLDKTNKVISWAIR
jgi:hypothetical protein